MSNLPQSHTRCGHVAIVGKANVGKSTLLNKLIGQKISITTRKPQTTRHHILGIKNIDHNQIIYIDTPGIQPSPKNAINRYMNRQALNIIKEVDVLLMMVEALKWNDDDELVLKSIASSNAIVMLVVNKIDRIADKERLLPFLNNLQSIVGNIDVVPISAFSMDDVNKLESLILEKLPVSEKIYGVDEITDRNLRFFAAELIREKLMQKLGDELPYESTVVIDQFKELKKNIHIHATIWVKRASQKAIVIGKNGSILKSIGEQARLEMEQMFGQKVFLETWVKQKSNWTDDENILKQFQFDV